MKSLTLALVSSLLVACVGCMPLPASPKPRQLVSAQGKVSYLVQCYKKSECAAQAEKLCPRGYDTINASSGPVEYDADGRVRKLTKYQSEITCK